jgi:hypothetical protein
MVWEKRKGVKLFLVEMSVDKFAIGESERPHPVGRPSM